VEALQQLLKELTQQERLAKELTDLQGPELAISVFGRTELEIAEEIKLLKISAIASQQSAVPEALTTAGSVPLKRPIEKLPAKKTDLARYLDEARLTERQRECISLKLEYGLGVTAIAERLGISRKTVDEHIEAAERNLSAARDREKNSANRARSGSQQ
jgi:DNA-binding CsgD family transcriptional regulator